MNALRNGFLIALLTLLTAVNVQAYELAGLDLHGFSELRAGARLQKDPYQESTSLFEGRLQLEASQQQDLFSWTLRGDLLADGVVEDQNQNLNRGSGVLDLREANLLFSPADTIDIKVGRQILTWGTGDLVFLNDLFPKDWQSFFIGRDTEYLKAPSDALMMSWFPDWGTLDLVYTPQFDPDRYISGERISYYNPLLGRRAGENDDLSVTRPDDWGADEELALRLSHTFGSTEAALYAYHGFWKSPTGFDAASGSNIFNELSVYGASLRAPLLGGVGNVEFSWYDSLDDRSGDDPLVPNSELRVLGGFERELLPEFTAGVQYYLEYLQDYKAYRRTLPSGTPVRDEYRHLLTLRLTRLLLNQNLTLSLFTFWSPSDEDFYLRPKISYKLSDVWLLTAGANLFGGKTTTSFFGQFEKNTNAYVGLRYSF